MAESFETRFLQFVRQHLLQCMTAVYLVPLLWGGLVPFDFSRTAPSPSDSVYFLGLPVIDTHLPDVLSNIALYILFGLLVRASLLERGWPRATSLLATVLLACE